MRWNIRTRTVTLWEAVCPQCGAVAGYGYSKQEAVAVAEEDGWVEGLCPTCYEDMVGDSHSPGGPGR
jgi:hypothetical protein